jgi:hypothetical protein
MKSVFLGAAVVLLSAAPALAGPIGSGLSHTEEVARRAAAQRTIAFAQPDQACARQAAKSVKAREGVAWTKTRPGEVLVAFRSGDHAAKQEAEVRAIVTETCRAA